MKWNCRNISFRKYLAIAWMFVASTLTNCHKEKVLPITGDIIGFVKMYDERGKENTDLRGVKVMIDENLFVFTDAQGRFEFNRIQPGTYKVLYEKEGYGRHFLYNFIFAGGNVPAVIPHVKLIALPAIEILTHSVGHDGGLISVSGSMVETDRYMFIFYFSDTPDASNETFKTYHSYSYCCGQLTSFTVQMAIPQVLTGSVYVAGYVASAGNSDGGFSYYNPEKERMINPAVKKIFDPVKVR